MGAALLCAEDARWLIGECLRFGVVIPCDGDIESYCERVAILVCDGGYKFDYQARQAAFDEFKRRMV